MAFQIKDFNSIVAAMINWMKGTQSQITDFSVGSVTRSLIEAPATELDEFYQQMFNGLTEAIPVSVYTSFSFAALGATSAGGLVTVSIAAQATATTIPAGAIFTANGIQYASTVDVTIAIAGTSASVPVSAVIPGSAGNLVGSSTFAISPSPAGFTSATNPAAFINGADAETDADRLIRFNAYISTLAKATGAAIVYGAKTTVLRDSGGNVIERVASASIVEPYLADDELPISSINCYIHNGVGSTSDALVSEAQKVVNGYTDTNGVQIPGWKAAGVICTVAKATESTRSVTAVLTAAPGYDHAVLVTAAQNALTSYLLGLPIGSAVLLANIIHSVMSIPGVANFVVSTPSGDTSAAANVKKMPGTLTIT